MKTFHSSMKTFSKAAWKMDKTIRFLSGESVRKVLHIGVIIATRDGDEFAWDSEVGVDDEFYDLADMLASC